jgi:uncharacterized repeat protein (TIGR03803 family)
VLHFFRGKDGAQPNGALIFDSAGNLYGTTVLGGENDVCHNGGCGTVFELTPGTGGQWTETVLWSFTGMNYDGANPQAGLVFDSAGNIYGTTFYGGTACENPHNFFTCGMVFELSPGTNGEWTETVVHDFGGYSDGIWPEGGLTFDTSGNLYGTTNEGGAANYGVVFECSPIGGGQWTEKVLLTFTYGADVGGFPGAGLIFDGVGNLYGTAGIGTTGDGLVFELSPATNGAWTETVLHNFTGGSDGAGPDCGLIFDSAGNLYGTTGEGGSNNDGVVFELWPGRDGTWNERILHRFNGSNGADATAGLIFDSAGDLYGTTLNGGSNGDGVAYELSPAGNDK